ncbi:MAG: 6-bladed beta-propeller [Rhodothermaceae bacterium]|nr:6-bladed beta-propeller [Rhodothermaceae bacterium]
MRRSERFWKPSSLFLVGVVVYAGCATKSDVEELQANVKRAELTEIFRVGVAESRDAVLFGNISDIGVTSDDQLLVADADAKVIYVFSESGDSLHTFGRPGNGPGEFESIRDMDIGPGDSVFVWDGRRDRLVVFEPETFQFSYDIEIESLSEGDRSATGLISINNDLLLMRFTAPYSLSSDEDGLDFDIIQFVNRDGRPVGEPLLRMPVVRHFLYRTESGMGLLLLPFPRRSSIKPGLDGTLYYGWNDSISFDVYSAGGDLLRTVRYGHEAVPVTQQDLDERIQSMSDATRQLFLREVEIPKTKPAYSTFTISDKNQIWIKNTPASDSLEVLWTVLGLDNQALFEFELPRNTNVRVVRGNRVYAEAELEDGAPYVVVYNHEPQA